MKRACWQPLLLEDLKAPSLSTDRPDLTKQRFAFLFQSFKRYLRILFQFFKLILGVFFQHIVEIKLFAFQQARKLRANRLGQFPLNMLQRRHKSRLCLFVGDAYTQSNLIHYCIGFHIVRVVKGLYYSNLIKENCKNQPFLMKNSLSQEKLSLPEEYELPKAGLKNC